jgi:hypothetical protein
MRRILACLVVLVGLVVAVPQSGRAAPAPTSADIVTQLQHLPDVTYLSEDPHPPAGFRLFNLEIRQPIDHAHPSRGYFEQHVLLYHVDVAAPMVVFTGGYFNYPYLSEPTAIVGGNQLSIEHRYFGDSRPVPTDWHYLTIWQEATDEHHIDQVFKTIYHAHWIATGISKGGMTAIYHRRFYPSDYSGTFAWSSPNDTDVRSTAYTDFLNHVDGAACRADLLRVQRAALQNRAALEAKIGAAADAAGETFAYWKHGLDEAFEVIVIQTPFVFWQYGGDCSAIPPPGASVDDLYAWYDANVGWLGVDDQQSEPFIPYTYQAATQLGWPTVDLRGPLGRLLHYQLSAQQPTEGFPPYLPSTRFDPNTMRDIDHWVRTQGAQLAFLYGQFDPWSALPFQLGAGSRDSYVYTVPGGNHLSGIFILPAGPQAALIATLQRWAGVAATGAAPTAARVAVAAQALPLVA